jgi:murein DD-endopeptidase MepM/ murein hydrolase activator NlpD
MKNMEKTAKQNKYSTRNSICFMLIVVLSLTMASVPVFAAEEADSEVAAESTDRTVTDIQNDLQSAKSQVEKAKQEYEQAKAEEKVIEEKIQSLEVSIRNTAAELEQLELEIADNIAKIDVLKAEITVMKANIEEQNGDLNARLRLMYMSGDQSLVEVLLGSEDFIDFMENLDMVKRIHEYDVQVLNELQASLDLLESKEAELVQIEGMLETSKAEQEAKKQKLDEDNVALAAAEAQAHQLTVEKYEIFEDTEAASAAIEAELRARTYTGDYTGGVMGWPTYGTITSEFGYRIHPIFGYQLLHAGIDIAVRTGTPIYAAAEGDVFFSGWNSGGYGNFVMIDHGGGVVTCYAHNSALAVSAGQHVTRGQLIAYAGSTGNSTGPHCHFEVRVSGVAQNPRGWL